MLLHLGHKLAGKEARRVLAVMVGDLEDRFRIVGPGHDLHADRHVLLADAGRHVDHGHPIQDVKRHRVVRACTR